MNKFSKKVVTFLSAIIILLGVSSPVLTAKAEELNQELQENAVVGDSSDTSEETTESIDEEQSDSTLDSQDEENNVDDNEVKEDSEVKSDEDLTKSNEIEPKAQVGLSLDDWNYTDQGSYIQLNSIKKNTTEDIIIPGKLNGKPVKIRDIAWPSHFSLIPDNSGSIIFQEVDGQKVGLTTKNLYSAFYFRTIKGNGVLDLRGLDTSGVSNFEGLFEGLTAQKLIVDGLDTSSVTNLYRSFRNSKIPNVSGLNTWNTSNVTTLQEMFSGSQVTSLDLSNLTDIQSISSDTFKCNLITQETFIGINEYNYDYFIFGCPVA